MRVEIAVGKKKIELPVARDYWARGKGLMFAKPQEVNGMLIDFRRMGKHEIWTVFIIGHLDIFYLDEDFTVVEKYERVPPVSLNPRTWGVLSPKLRARYALELWAGKIELDVGDKIDVSLL